MGSPAKIKNAVEDVFVPTTGKIAVAPAGTAVPTAQQGKARALELNEAFEELGLFTTDGGFEWNTESKGDRLEFFQEGYSMASPETEVTLKVTLAQSSRKILELLRGQKFDENFHTVVDAAGNSKSYVIWVEEVSKTGRIRRRCCENAKIVEMKQGKAERGSVYGTEVTFQFDVAAGHAGGQFHEWFMEDKELS